MHASRRDLYASLAGNHIARVDPRPESRAAGSSGRTPGLVGLWRPTLGRGVGAGQLGRYDPSSGEWQEWRLPGERPQAYAVYVDERDIVWLTDFGGDAIVRFDPTTESFSSIALASPDGAVRQLSGRPGEVWGAESSADKIVVVTEE